MDTETLKVLIALGEHGGSVAMLIAVFIAGRASRVAAEAVENLKAIRVGLDKGFAEMARRDGDSDEKLDAIRNELSRLPLQIVSIRR